MYKFTIHTRGNNNIILSDNFIFLSRATGMLVERQNDAWICLWCKRQKKKHIDTDVPIRTVVCPEDPDFDEKQATFN